MTANLRQYVIFIKPRTFDTANIQCFTVTYLDIERCLKNEPKYENKYYDS